MKDGIIMDHLQRSGYPYLVQAVAVTNYTTFCSSLHQCLWAIRHFLLGHQQHSWSCHMTSLRMIWWSCFSKYCPFIWWPTFHWILSLAAWFCVSCLFSRNSASAIISASLGFSSSALSMKDLLLLDLVLLELSDIADFDPIFEDLLTNVPVQLQYHLANYGP